MTALTGVWLAATRVHHRNVGPADDYPHICFMWITGRHGRERLGRRECARCADRNDESKEAA